MENASKQLQNDEEEDGLFVSWFYTVAFLGSLKKKEKQKLEKIFIFGWLKIYINHTIIRGKFNPSRTELEEKWKSLKQYPR